MLAQEKVPWLYKKRLLPALKKILPSLAANWASIVKVVQFLQLTVHKAVMWLASSLVNFDFSA